MTKRDSKNKISKPYKDEKKWINHTKSFGKDEKENKNKPSENSSSFKQYKGEKKRVKPIRSFEKNEREKPPEKDPDFIENIQLEGRNAVLEAIKNGRSMDKLLIKSGDKEGTIRVIIAKAREAGYVVVEVSKEKLDAISQTRNHQGVIALCPSHEYAEVSDMLKFAAEKGEDPFLIVLDNVTDPHNLGAIIRTAEAVGAHGVIIPKRRAVGVTAVTVKASAGAVEYMPVARASNLTSTIENLKKQGIWVCAAEMGGQVFYDAPLTGPIAAVIGSEGSGISRLISEKCDFKVSIPMTGKISSLNASVAAGLIMYEIVRQRTYKR